MIENLVIDIAASLKFCLENERGQISEKSQKEIGFG